MKRILTASLLAISSLSFAQVSAEDKVFIGETDSNEVVYIIAPSLEIKKTQRGNFYIKGDAEVTSRDTGKSDFWSIGAPLMTCANGRGMTVITNLSAMASGVPAEQAIQQFYWEKQGTKTADAIIRVICLVAEKMVNEAIEAPKSKPKSGTYL